MLCPQCEEQMKQSTIAEVTINECPGCRRYVV
jgi:Zn-finger nucleic acid-binding protein